MFDDQKLWKERFGSRVKDLSRYLRYIFNGHLVVVLLFLIGGGAFYYQNWITGLSNSFPVVTIMAFVLAIFLTYSPVYNFLLEADRIFLIPLENRLKRYFLRSGVASFVFQGYILLMVFAILMPMYAHVGNHGFRLFFPFFVVLLAAKAWNLVVSWQISYFVQPSVYLWDMVVRFCINALLCYLLLQQAHLLFLLVIVVVMVFYYRSYFVRTRKIGLKWDLLIASEEKRMASFYRLANLFTDVPKVKDTVKRRRWLDFFLNRIGFSQDKTYLYLFSRTFLRASDYLGLFLRLTVIGMLALYFITFGWGQIVLTLLFLYLTGFQLLPLWNHHQNKLWVDLYPVAAKHKFAAFRLLLMVILSIEVVIFTIVILLKGQLIISLLTFLAGICFNYIFTYIYSKNRLKP
ncbi:ABC transporter permease [Neobacillus massiliamazoniensis]|uniref:ABC transporter EcsB n=1 Tax=Neobacillus massiliamazoniensis TaxID=1499688 RepID=A0A0U1NZW8_9BACI|nr:ABC transporter permease [Neobacillus massiliamazoniensis]CRK83537.1 ABC transporter EcsB [Neobacillus massiliamazoniensis]